MAEVKAKVDPRRSAFIAIFGKKFSGKSFLARRFFDTYPFDRLMIDVNADIEVDPDEVRTYRGDQLPLRWPPHVDLQGRAKPQTLRYVPDPGSKTYADDLDRAVGLAFNHRKVLVWIDEIDELAQANRVGPYMRRALHQGRHRDLSLLECGPRAMNLDPLVIAQADFVYVFDLPHPHDRERVAQVIGYPPRAFDAAVAALGEHEYLRWDGHELVHFPKLPEPAKVDRGTTLRHPVSYQPRRDNRYWWAVKIVRRIMGHSMLLEHVGDEEIHEHPGCVDDGKLRWVCSCGATGDLVATPSECETDWRWHVKRDRARWN